MAAGNSIAVRPVPVVPAVAVVPITVVPIAVVPITVVPIMLWGPSGPSRLACTRSCRRGGASYPSGIGAWPPPYRWVALPHPPASRRGHNILGHNFRGHNIHRDMHASAV